MKRSLLRKETGSPEKEKIFNFSVQGSRKSAWSQQLQKLNPAQFNSPAAEPEQRGPPGGRLGREGDVEPSRNQHRGREATERSPAPLGISPVQTVLVKTSALCGNSLFYEL